MPENARELNSYNAAFAIENFVAVRQKIGAAPEVDRLLVRRKRCANGYTPTGLAELETGARMRKRRTFRSRCNSR